MPKQYGSIPHQAYDAIRRLHFVVGLTYAQIADGFECSPSRIRQIVKGYRSYVTPSGGHSSKPPVKEQ